MKMDTSDNWGIYFSDMEDETCIKVDGIGCKILG